VIGGLLNIGTHMSIIQLSSGKFLVVDTVPLDDKLTAEINALTNDGKDIEAVIATHPFHTLAFPGFYEKFPSAPYYGTPRHLRVVTQVPWTGCISDPQLMDMWMPDVELRIPAGAEWVSPLPESSNHFNSCWVFSPRDRTVHVDDTLCYIADPPLIVKWLGGLKKGHFMWHTSLSGPGLYHTQEAPFEFKAWVEAILQDWDFDNICCAHIENKIGGAHDALEQALKDVEPTLQKLSDKAKKEGDQKAEDEKAEDCSKYNVSGNECG